MYVSDWTPTKTLEEGEVHIHGRNGDSGAFRPLIALVAAVFLAISTMFACGYVSSHSVCATHVAAQQC